MIICSTPFCVPNLINLLSCTCSSFWSIKSSQFCVPVFINLVHFNFLFDVPNTKFSFKSRSKTSVFLQIFNMKKWKPNWLKSLKMLLQQKLWNLRSFNGILQNLMRLSLPYVVKVCFKCMTAKGSFNKYLNFRAKNIKISWFFNFIFTLAGNNLYIYFQQCNNEIIFIITYAGNDLFIHFQLCNNKIILFLLKREIICLFFQLCNNKIIFIFI